MLNYYDMTEKRRNGYADYRRRLRKDGIIACGAAGCGGSSRHDRGSQRVGHRADQQHAGRDRLRRQRRGLFGARICGREGSGPDAGADRERRAEPALVSHCAQDRREAYDRACPQSRVCRAYVPDLRRPRTFDGSQSGPAGGGGDRARTAVPRGDACGAVRKRPRGARRLQAAGKRDPERHSAV